MSVCGCRYVDLATLDVELLLSSRYYSEGSYYPAPSNTCHKKHWYALKRTIGYRAVICITVFFS